MKIATEERTKSADNWCSV